MSNSKNALAPLLTAIGVVAIAAMPSLAQAASITLTFDCQVLSASANPDVCGPSGNFGTLTLTDSAIDTNRVDISWNMTPPWGVNIEKVLLNYNGTVPANHELLLVAANAPAGSTTNLTGSTHTIGNVPQGTTYVFDIRVGEASPSGLTCCAPNGASLALRNQIGGAFVDLSIASFLATSGTLNGATPPLYALYATVQGPAVPAGWTASSGSEFWAGVTVVPVPAAVWLLGSALGVLGMVRRKISS